MKNEYAEPAIPSNCKELLSSIIGEHIGNLIRYSWWESYDDGAECGVLKKSDFFARGPGPLLVQLKSGLVIGFSDDSSNNSILVWVESDGHGYVTSEPLAQDIDLREISAEDSCYSDEEWSALLNEKISDIVLLRQETTKAKYADLANEVGIVVILEGGKHFVLSHGLHDNSDDFALIRLNDILPSILEQLVAVSLSKS